MHVRRRASEEGRGDAVRQQLLSEALAASCTILVRNSVRRAHFRKHLESVDHAGDASELSKRNQARSFLLHLVAA